MKRPLLLVGLLYVAGILAGEYLPFSPTGLLWFLAAIVAAAFAWRPGRSILLSAAVVIAGSANIALQEASLSPNDLRNVLETETQIVSVRGRLLETPVIHEHESAVRVGWSTQSKLEVSALKPHRGEWRPALGRIIIATPAPLTNLFAGQTVEVNGVIGPPPQAVAEGLFDYRSYLRRLGYYFELKANSDNDWHVLASSSAPPLADRFRAWARKALALGLPSEDESLRLEWALTLGWKAALTDEVSEPFIRAATYHIFAVDGLRMAIIFGILLGLLRAFSVPRSVIGIVALPLIWFYVALTGWPASAIRATVMLSIVILGWILRRPGELINSLFAAALIILIWQPQQLFQAGFQLSFFVVLCIILTIPVLQNWTEKMVAPDPLLPKALHPRLPYVVRVPTRYVWGVLITSFAAWIGSLPLVAYYFNIVTPVSTPANLLAVPLCALVLMSNLASLLLAGWFKSAAVIFNNAGWFLMECIRVSSDWFASWPKAYAYVAAPHLFTSAFYYAALIAAMTGWLFRPAFRALKLAVLCLLTICWATVWCQDASIARLTVLPVSGASALFYDRLGIKNDLLVDCGRDYGVNSIVKPFLRAQGVNRLSAFAISHGEARSMAGAPLLTSLFPIDHIYASPVPSRSPDYRNFIDSCRGNMRRFTTVSRGDKVNEWTVLHPDSADHFSQGDDNSLVLLQNVAGARLLLLSELGKAGQKALLKRSSSLKADIVISGLTNRGEALTDELLNSLRPQLLIITDSEFPVQQRATPKLKQRLAKNRIPILYMRDEGAITIEFSGSHWQLRTMNGTKLNDRALATK